jgi:hypothetical protein
MSTYTAERIAHLLHNDLFHFLQPLALIQTLDRFEIGIGGVEYFSALRDVRLERKYQPPLSFSISCRPSSWRLRVARSAGRKINSHHERLS